MKKARLISLFLLVVLLAAVGTVAANDNFVAHLAGRNEVLAVDTRAQGEAIFHLSEDSTLLDYKLIVANIENVTQSHIHCGAAGVNGPVVAFLYGFGPTVSPDGILAQGTLSGGDVIPRPDSAACPGGVADFNDLVAKIQSGNAYVNVHTVQHPGGEIRGQIR